MTNSFRKTLSGLACESRGTEIAEAAAVLPVMFMILIGIFWFGQAFSIYGTITRAAQEGARAAAAPQCSTCSATTPSTNAYSALQTVLVTARLDPTKLHRPSSTPALVSCVDDATAVACDASLTNVCLQKGVEISSIGSNVCGMSMSFQYPYAFWLPYTSLNKQTINLTATARVRLETM